MSDCLDTLMCLHRAFRELEEMQFENVMGVGAFSLGHDAYWGLGASWHLEACIHCESFICCTANVQNASIVNFPCTPYSHIKTNSKTSQKHVFLLSVREAHHLLFQLCRSLFSGKRMAWKGRLDARYWWHGKGNLLPLPQKIWGAAFA